MFFCKFYTPFCDVYTFLNEKILIQYILHFIPVDFTPSL